MLKKTATFGILAFLCWRGSWMWIRVVSGNERRYDQHPHRPPHARRRRLVENCRPVLLRIQKGVIIKYLVFMLWNLISWVTNNCFYQQGY